MSEKNQVVPDLKELKAGTIDKKDGVLHITLEERTDCVVVKAIDSQGEGWTLLKISNDDRPAQGPAYVSDDLHVDTDRTKDSVVVFH